jgi:hypothetical protein
MSVPVRLPFQYDACVFQYDLTFQYTHAHSSTVMIPVQDSSFQYSKVLVGNRYVGAEKSIL